jgi:hypothetical protein
VLDWMIAAVGSLNILFCRTTTYYTRI